jgi:hypothetical protein
MKKRDGTQQSPARDCRELFEGNPDLKSGTYWVDPDGGSKLNAIQVTCRKEAQSTCISPSKDQFNTRPYNSRQTDQPTFVASLLGLDQFEYQTETSQLNFLRLHSDRAVQQLTYRCRNSVAVEDSQGRRNKSVILYTAGDKEYTATDGFYQYTVIQDDCKYSKSSEAKTVIEVDTKMATHLPVIDIGVSDFGSSDKAFGLEIGEVCFS